MYFTLLITRNHETAPLQNRHNDPKLSIYTVSRTSLKIPKIYWIKVFEWPE